MKVIEITDAEYAVLHSIVENGWADGDFEGYGGVSKVIQNKALDKFNNPVEKKDKKNKGNHRWVDVNEVVNVVNKAKNDEWNWTKNIRCKYINVRIDMRDGACLVFDNDKKPITVNELLKQ